MGLVHTLIKLSPHRVEHKFGNSSLSRIVTYTGYVEVNVLMSFVICNMLSTVLVSSAIRRKAAAFFFDLEPCVYIFLKQIVACVLEVPDLVNFL